MGTTALKAGFQAVRVAPNALAVTLDLPTAVTARQPAVRACLDGSLVQGQYDQRREVVFHLRDDALAAGLAPNPTAWAVASALRGLQLGYDLYGPVLLTGADAEGRIAPLPPERVAALRWACRRARDVLRAAPAPADSGQLARMVLVAVEHGLTTPYN